ncbi:hypothetical protein ACWCXH_38930, partial [Kitasatospora sp. NPDC001660]
NERRGRGFFFPMLSMMDIILTGAEAPDQGCPPKRIKPTTPPPFDPKKQPDPLTQQGCLADLPSESVYVQDRFNACSSHDLYIGEKTNGVLQGLGVFRYTVIGSAGFGDTADRILTFQNLVDDIRVEGEFNPAVVLDGAVFCTAAVGKGECHSRNSFHTSVFEQWRLTGGESWSFNVDVPPGGGVGRDDVIKEYLSPGFNITFPPGYDSDHRPIGLLPFLVRWDNASYVKQGDSIDGAAIFDDIAPLTYNFSYQGTDQATAHIYDALAYPNNTVPSDPWGKKIIPGFKDNPLHRLYKNYSPPDSETRYNANRTTATAQCGPRHGKECDEFPMASTYEGAAKADYELGADPWAYSARLIDRDDNQKAGRIAQDFYAWYRVLDPGFDSAGHPRGYIDSFYIQILP